MGSISLKQIIEAGRQYDAGLVPGGTVTHLLDLLRSDATVKPAVGATMMVKVLVYGYATGVFRSRKIARKLHEDVAFRVLAADNFPAHRTIRGFRALHLVEINELFVLVARLAREMGLVKLGTIAVDGTKIKANASRH